MKYYQFLFYNLAIIWKNKKDEIENAPINSLITITFLPFLNLLSIPLIIMAIFGISAFQFPTFNKWLILIPLAIFGILNYFILLRNGKSKIIMERFNQLDKKIQKKGQFVSILYIVISIAIPLIILFFVSPKP